MPFFSRLVYSLLYTLFIVAYGPYYLLRTAARRQAPIPWLERLGRVPTRLASPCPGAPHGIWIHAVSVGEVNLLRPLVTVLSQQPGPLFISTVTETGQALARELFGQEAEIFYFPLDFAWSCKRYLDRIRPQQILIVETEIWPNFIWQAARRSIPVSIINGRISDASFKKYHRVRVFLAPFLSCIHHFCMQSREDKRRILGMGAPEDRVHVVGNLKFDYQLAPSPEKEKVLNGIGAWMGRGGAPIWVCGSTREGEERILIGVFQDLRRNFPLLRLILVPRHPHRSQQVLNEIQLTDLAGRLRSQVGDAPAGAPPDCLIFDSIGELAYLYAVADVVFVGGSLFPTGGHNVIEAAHFSKAILFGPHMQNFREISTHFLSSYAALQVESAEQLGAKMAGLLEDPAARRWLGRNARKVVRVNNGALERTLGILQLP